jgi:hypothetical protein
MVTYYNLLLKIANMYFKFDTIFIFLFLKNLLSMVLPL